MPRYLMRLEYIRTFIDNLPTGTTRFLEIGPGLGDVSAYLTACFPYLTGTLIESSEDGAKMLKQRFNTTKRLDVLHKDFLSHGTQQDYDLIIACEVLEHIDDDLFALKLIHKQLTSKGYIIISVPAFMNKWEIADEYVGHYRRYEREELVNKLMLCGFEIEHMWCYGFPVTHLLYLFRQLYYGRKLNNLKSSKEESTQKSGIERPYFGGARNFPIGCVMRPFFFLQDKTKNTDIGDGFVILARKAN